MSSNNDSGLYSASTSTLNISNNQNPDIENVIVSGRRIINIEYFINEIKNINDHSPFSCNISHTKVIGEQKNGFNSIITLQCSMCNVKFKLCTEDPSDVTVPINTAIVSGVLSIGAGYSQLQQFTSAINVPCMGSHLYNTEQNKVYDCHEEIAAKEMEKSAKEEARLAIEAGNVDTDGTFSYGSCWW